MKRLFVLSLATLIFYGCELTSSDKDLFDHQKYLFEIEYINHAWGRVWTGLYVDDLGRIFSYDLSDTTWDHQSDTSFSAAELMDKYSHDNKRIGTIDPGVLAQQRVLIRGASEGNLTEPVGRCADFGVVTYSAFLYDAQKDRYTPVLLQQEGDLARKNDANGAALLVSWLKTLDERFDNAYCLP